MLLPCCLFAPLLLSSVVQERGGDPRAAGERPVIAPPLAPPSERWACQANAIFQGSQPLDHLGAHVSAPGDWNGDGVSDALLGGLQRWPDQPWLTGCAFLYLAPFEGNDGNERFEAGAVTFRGETGGERFGWSADFVGDVDGDGRDDVAIGAPRARRTDPPAEGDEEPKPVFGEAGLVYLYLTRHIGDLEPGSTLTSADATCVLRDPRVGKRFGWSLCRLGDLEGDGFGDFAVGATSGELDPTPGPGSVVVFSGKRLVETILQRRKDGDQPELLVQEVAARVFLGREPGDRFGYSLAWSDRIAPIRGEQGEGDAQPETTFQAGLVVGAPQFSFKGKRAERADLDGMASTGDGYVQVLPQRLLVTGDGKPFSLENPDAGSFGRFGQAVATGFDADGQLGDDLVVGAPSFDADGEAGKGDSHGRAYLFALPLPKPVHTVTGPLPRVQLGWSVAGCGSLDKDPRDDWAVGLLLYTPPTPEGTPCPGDPELGTAGSGAVLFYSGAPGGDEPRLLGAIYGQDGRDRFSWSMAYQGERDGVPQLLVGSVGWPDDRRGRDEWEEVGRAYWFALPAKAAKPPEEAR